MPKEIDLRKLAYDAMRNEGFVPEPPDAVVDEARRIGRTTARMPSEPAAVDLRSLLWCSVDNVESRDLDQVEYAERMPDGRVRLLVGIADVDALVPAGSAIDRFALANSTSVYTGIHTFPMLPDALSEGLTSLLPGTERLAVVTEMVLDRDGEVDRIGAFRALVRNHAKLDYESVGAWLEKTSGVPPEIADAPGLQEQVMLQYEATERLERYRERNGALNLETPEARPVTKGGKIVDLVSRDQNEARDMIENLMVAANSATADYLRSRGFPVIQRVVREPERWPMIVRLARRAGDDLPEAPDSRALAAFLDRQRRLDPRDYPDLSLKVVKLLGAAEYVVVRPEEGEPEHFGLAVRGYSRSTAPNRRYTDLVTQRMLKAAVAGEEVPYSVARLEEIAEHCRERERAARKVERRLRKAGAAILLADRIGDEFSAIVTGATPKGTFVRLLRPPAEGKVVRGWEGMEVGETVRVRLVGAEPERGFIDFVGV